MRELELRLQEENPQFRRIWIQYSEHRGYRMVLTLFPRGNGTYRMAFGQPNDLSYESINTILQNYLQSMN